MWRRQTGRGAISHSRWPRSRHAIARGRRMHRAAAGAVGLHRPRPSAWPRPPPRPSTAASSSGRSVAWLGLRRTDGPGQRLSTVYDRPVESGPVAEEVAIGASESGHLRRSSGALTRAISTLTRYRAAMMIARARPPGLRRPTRPRTPVMDQDPTDRSPTGGPLPTAGRLVPVGPDASPSTARVGRPRPDRSVGGPVSDLRPRMAQRGRAATA